MKRLRIQQNCHTGSVTIVWVAHTPIYTVAPSDNGSEESEMSRSNAEESQQRKPIAGDLKRWNRDWRVLMNCCTAAAICYVLAIDVLRNVASTR